MLKNICWINEVLNLIYSKAFSPFFILLILYTIDYFSLLFFSCSYFLLYLWLLSCLLHGSTSNVYRPECVSKSLTLFILFILLFHFDEFNHTNGQPVPSILFLWPTMYIFLGPNIVPSIVWSVSIHLLSEWILNMSFILLFWISSAECPYINTYCLVCPILFPPINLFFFLSILFGEG